jgi:ectoine hydroxylase-related dioxygenase (phytanoyl-CoA dioxygenase family)
MGGTAFVHGSHRLSVSAWLLSEDEDNRMPGDDDDGTDAAMMRRKMLQLRTLRPALDAGDILFFDCRTIHYAWQTRARGTRPGKR